MDMMSNFENMDVMLGDNNTNAIERELSNVIGNSKNHCDVQSNLQSRENDSHVNDVGHFVHENTIPRQDRFQETMETITSETFTGNGLNDVHDVWPNKQGHYHCYSWKSNSRDSEHG